MAKYKVNKVLVIQATVQIIVEADSVEDAEAAACEIVPSNIGNDYRTAGWKAKVQAKPPKGVEVVSHDCKVSWIDSTDDKTRARKIAAD